MKRQTSTKIVFVKAEQDQLKASPTRQDKCEQIKNERKPDRDGSGTTMYLFVWVYNIPESGTVY
jgi:hypothetical protein